MTRASGPRTPAAVWAAYRARYATLPSGLQIIGLQLWLPLLVVVAFCFCYIAAFHAPSPHHVRIAVVGNEARVSAFATRLQENSRGGLQVSVETSETRARADVRSGRLAAAYVPGSTRLIVATANNYQLSSEARSTFAAVATEHRATLHTDDIAPLPARDAYGTTLFYLALVVSVSGYITGSFIGISGGDLSPRLRYAIMFGSSVVWSLLATVFVRFALAAVTTGFWAIWGVGLLTAFAVQTVVSSLGYFIGRFVPGVALLLFVFANVPASGGAYPPEFLPQPFRALHHVVAGTGTLDMLRSIIYRVGPGAGHGAVILLAWAISGVLLGVVGRPFSARRRARRAAERAPLSMLLTAQTAALTGFNDARSADAPTETESGDDSDERLACRAS